MTWVFTLQPEVRMPPCPYCGSILGVVRLRQAVFVCMDHLPRQAFGAHWVDDDPLETEEIA